MGQDGGDKSVPKSLTIALKYALRQAFLMETGDDPDVHQPVAPTAPLPSTEEVRRALRHVGAKDRRTADALCRAVTDQGDGSCSVTSVAQATSDDTTAEIVLDGLRAALKDLGPEKLLKAAEQYMDKE